MLLLVGLGNPGPEHAGHRHNVGFMAVDAIIHRCSFAAPRRRFHGVVAEGRIDSAKVLALKPLTWMNRSGIAVLEAARYYRLTPAEVIVFHDELDLRPAKVRVKRGGGSAGHNGLRDVDRHLGRDYRRVRIGIGHPDDRDSVMPYVLHDFAKADHEWLDTVLAGIAQAAPLLVAGDDPGFMTKVALLVNPPRRDARPRSNSTGSPGDARVGSAVAPNKHD